jgi:MFS transporter, putative metabolite transport protein
MASGSLPTNAGKHEGQPERIPIQRSADIFRYVNALPSGSAGSGFVILVALGSIFVDFYDLGAFSIGAVQLNSELHLTGTGLSLLTAAAPAGAIIGGLIGGRLTDRVGRLPMLLIDLLLFVACALGSALAPNAIVLGLFRLGVGLGIGLDVPVALAFVAESRGLRNKSRILNSWQMISTGGTVLLYLLMSGMLHLVGADSLWRWAVGFGALFALIVLVLRFALLAESPLWLAAEGRLSEAVDLLNSRFRANLILVSVEDDPPQASASRAARQARGALSSYLALFQQPGRLRTTMISLVAFTEAAEYFAIGFYTPVIVQTLLGKNLLHTLLGSAAISAIGGLGALACFLLTERIGFRGVGRLGFSLTLGCLLVVGAAGKSLPVLIGALFIAIFNFGHQVGPGAIAASMGSLSYPTEVRGTAGGWTQAMIRTGTLVGTFVFPLLLSSLGLYRAVLVIAAAPLTGLITVVTMRWDPVGQDVDAREGEHRVVDASS